jgi:hypothetical protein
MDLAFSATLQDVVSASSQTIALNVWLIIIKQLQIHVFYAILLTVLSALTITFAPLVLEVWLSTIMVMHVSHVALPIAQNVVLPTLAQPAIMV